MSMLLSPAKQEEFFKTIQLVLDNFSLASRVASLLIEYRAADLLPPHATIELQGAGRDVKILGENCGFFSTPVIQMAVLDCRRSLAFFGLTCDPENNRIKATSIKKRFQDDLDIESFGLPVVTPQRFLETVSSVVSAPVESILVSVYRWSNKQLAHFTVDQPRLTLEEIRDASEVMIEAYMRLVFEALERPRPPIQLSVN